jgi:hypothetical protein
MPRQPRRDRPRREHSGAALIASATEAWVCIVGSVTAVVGGVVLILGLLTRDKEEGIGGAVILGFAVLAFGVVLVEVALAVLRSRRSDHFPGLIEYVLATRPKRRRALDRRIARVRSFFAAVRFLRGGSPTSPRPSSDRIRDPRREAPAAP